ncbi:MAG: SCO family protein [Ferruginibacter sp.]
MMTMKRKWLIYVGFFILLLAVFYAVIFRDYDFSASKLSVINPAVPEFHLTDQDSNAVSQRMTDDKVYVAEYFFTTCKGICPRMNANMRRVYDAFKNEKDFLILSHTCQPEVDSLPLLRAYANRMIYGKLVKKPQGSYEVLPLKNDIRPSKTNWIFLTGDKAQLYNLARQGYLIDNGKPDSTQRIEDQFIHTQFFALVDKYRRVRGIYDGLEEKEIQKLLGDIPGLLKEKVDHTRFMNGFSNSPN